MILTPKYIFYLILSLGGFSTAVAQNLVANPSFEDVNICTEFTAPCAPAAWESVAPESTTLQYIYHRFGGAGTNAIRLKHAAPDRLRNYAQTQLLCPLEKGRSYTITLVGWMDGGKPPELDMRFDTGWIYNEFGEAMLRPPPAIKLRESDKVSVNSKGTAWTLRQTFVAGGNYNHIAIGNFSSANHAPRITYVYIDSLSIAPSDGGVLCENALSVRDSLYARHRRHSIPGKHFRDMEEARYRIRQRTRRCVTLRVKGPGTFTPAGRAMEPENVARLDSAIRAYTPNTGAEIRITGYAFRPGSHEYNKIVAATEARKVADLLVYKHGFSFDEITTDSKGNTVPPYDTATEEGRERNNFVELEFCIPIGEDETLPPPPVTAVRPDTVKIPDAMFRFNSADLIFKLNQVLDSLIAVIPRDGSVQLMLVGHTDNRGEEDYNMELSLKRAQSVADYLRSVGLGPAIRHVSGEGERRPFAPNTNEEGRRLNRRVEIIIYKGNE
ncbi:OmpA family protein [Chitinophaga lutea]